MRLSTSLLLAAVLLSMAAPSHAAEVAPPAAAAPSSSDTEAQLRQAELLGERLLRLDRAAWVASDQLMAASRGRADARVRGWITDEHDDRIDVIFVDATPAALYRVTVDADGQPAGPIDNAPAPLTPAQAIAARSVAAAELAAPPSCSGTYNPIVMPGDAPENTVVYLIPGSTDPARLPVGGAWRFALHGAQIVSRRSFTTSCIALENPEEAEAIYITHLLDPLPTEIHVFWSLWSGKPMAVKTARGTWAIENGRFRALPDNALDDPDATTP